MKILLFTDSLGAGGAQRQLVGLACMLKNNDYQVKVITYYNYDFYKYVLDSNNIESVVLPKAINLLSRLIKVRTYIKSYNPDWVIAYQETPSLFACLVKFLSCNYKLIVSERNTTQKITFKDKIRFSLYRYADKIVPNSYTQTELLADNYVWMKDRLQTITNFVDLDKFSFKTIQLSKSPLIIVVSSIWPPKNTIGMIEAVRVLVSLGYNFNIKWYGLVDGQDEYVSKCLSLIEKYKLSEYICLLPKIKNIEDIYKECHFFCLPSFYEGTPNVICEAIASGRPVICSDVCDNKRYVHDTVNGFLFNPNDSNDIAQAIVKALQLSTENYLEMCKSSRNIAEELLDASTFFKKYNDIIVSVPQK